MVGANNTTKNIKNHELNENKMLKRQYFQENKQMAIYLQLFRK